MNDTAIRAISRQAEEYFWRAQFIRYLLTPNQNNHKLVDDLHAFYKAHTPSPFLSHPFISIHVRYGDKYKENPPVPLSIYAIYYKKLAQQTEANKHITTQQIQTETTLSLLHTKRPFSPSQSHTNTTVPAIFLSTEKDSVLKTLPALLPTIPIHAFQYQRINAKSPPTEAKSDLLPSLANLYVSVWADGFIGTLTSNWCRLIKDMELTRGDGGHDYMSVDGRHDRWFW